jgi:outer membrane biogenesis lipoprotein LolB
MFSKKIQAMASLLFIASALLAACTPAAATPEVIVQTQIVTVAGT